MNTSNLDYKWISIIIMMSLAFSGLGYVLNLGILYLQGSDQINITQCDNLNETSWSTSSLHDDFKTLDQYKNACKSYIHSINESNVALPIILIVIIPFIIGFGMVKTFGIYKEKNGSRD